MPWLVRASLISLEPVSVCTVSERASRARRGLPWRHLREIVRTRCHRSRGLPGFDLEVQDVAATVSLAQRPDPPVVQLCRRPGAGGDPLGNGTNADMYGVIWSGQSGGNHTVQLHFSSSSNTVSGSSGQANITYGWAYSDGAANQNTQIWVLWDGVATGHTTRGAVPNC